jgi:hypothetical protein
MTKELVFNVISARKIIGPIFYGDTVNAVSYVNNIPSPFFAELTEEERLYGVFQQDSATAHTAYILWKNCGRFSVTT